MSRVSTYLNFPGTTEKAFMFYKAVFETEFDGPMMRYKDVPPSPDEHPLSESDRNLIMNVSLPILGGHVLMGTDATESMGFKIIPGNNFYINLEPDTREETDDLFQALSEGGTVDMELQDMFWGSYYGSCTDKFGVRWMFNCSEK